VLNPVTTQTPMTSADTSASTGGTPPSLTLAVNTSRGLFLSGLQFPYPTDIAVISGKLTLALPRALPRELAAGSSTLVSANNRFDLLLLPATGVAATGRCRLTLDRATTQRNDRRRLLSHEAARLVFESPADAWTVALLAERLGVSVTRLRARLFVENAGARYIIKTQRIQHAFTTLITTDLPLARIAASSGWPNARALKLALRDGLLINPEQVERVQPKPALRSLPGERFWGASPLLMFGDGHNSRTSGANGIRVTMK